MVNVAGSIRFSTFDCAAWVFDLRSPDSGSSMFSRCASGSCDFLPFSVDDRAWNVEDIALNRELDGLLREKLDSLVKGFSFGDSIFGEDKSGNCSGQQLNLKRLIDEQEVRSELYPRLARLTALSACRRSAPMLR